MEWEFAVQVDGSHLRGFTTDLVGLANSNECKYFSYLFIYTINHPSHSHKLISLVGECEWLTTASGRETTSCYPSQTVISPLILRRPLTKSSFFWDWRDSVANGNLYRKNITLNSFNREYKSSIIYNIYNAWPSSVGISVLDTALETEVMKLLSQHHRSPLNEDEGGDEDGEEGMIDWIPLLLSFSF